MAAPSLDVDWEAIKAHAITHGVRPAARAFGIAEPTVQARSARESWFAEIRTVVSNPKALLPISQKPIATNATNASGAARNAMQTLSNKSKLGIAIAVAKGANKAKRLKGSEILAKSTQLKALAETGDKVFGWSGSGATPVMRLELIAGAVGQANQDELPAIDVEAEVLPSSGEIEPSIYGTETNS